MAILVFFFLLFEAQWFYIIDVKESESEPSICATISNFTTSCNNIYKYFDSLFYSYLPITLMSIINLAIMFKLCQAKFQNNKDNKNSLSKATKGITVMLIGASMLFITCTLPHTILYENHSDFSIYAYAVLVLLIYVNHSVNIIVHTVMLYSWT